MRKAQDIVLLAFARFAQAHPEAQPLLVTAWHNQWPGLIKSITAAGLVKDAPDVARLGAVRGVEEWLGRHGIARGQRLVLGKLTQREVAAALQRADVAVFPNRAEGGTNLVAMEAMATGVPVVISNNTGHVDIVGDGAHCYALARRPMLQRGWAKFTQGWGESTVESVVEALEAVYADRAAAREKGRLAAAFIRKHFTWEQSVARISGLLREHGI